MYDISHHLFNRGMLLLQTLEGHSDRCWSLAWSPDGSTLASCSGDKTVRIWSPAGAATSSLNSWKCSAVLEDGHTRTIRSLAWSPCGKFLATASFDATTAIWQHHTHPLNTAQEGSEQGRPRWEQVASLEGHENEVKCVTFSPDGSLVATCGRDRTVWIWESIPGNEYECVDVKTGHSQDVKSIAFHPSREVLASASYDDTIKVWACEPGGDEWTCAQTIGSSAGGHSSTVWSLSFQPSGHHMASVGDDSTLKVWKCSSPAAAFRPPWKLACSISGYHSSTIYDCHWSPVSDHIATGDGSNNIRIFSPIDAKEQQDQAMASSSDGDGGEAEGARELSHWGQVAAVDQAHAQDVNCVRWNPKIGGLLASCGDDGLVKIWQMR